MREVRGQLSLLLLLFFAYWFDTEVFAPAVATELFADMVVFAVVVCAAFVWDIRFLNTSTNSSRGAIFWVIEGANVFVYADISFWAIIICVAVFWFWFGRHTNTVFVRIAVEWFIVFTRFIFGVGAIDVRDFAYISVRAVCIC